MTTLEDHRIERMRSAVMGVVDEDVRRRGRRTRVVVRSAAAVCAVAIVVGVGAPFTGGHDNRAGTASSDSATVKRSGPVPLHAKTSTGSGSATAAAPARVPNPGRRSAAAGRKVITTGSAHIVTKTPLNSSEDFISWVQSNGGRVDGQSDTGVGHRAYVSLTVRVPDEEAAITRLRALGSVDRVETRADDVTTQATDLDARIKETRISIARLETILSRTTSVRDVLTAESALTTRQQQLESMVEQRKTLSQQVALATLDVTFAAKSPAQAVAHHPGWFHRTLHKFDVSANAVLDTILYVLPWLILAGLIALLWAAVVRLTRGRG